VKAFPCPVGCGRSRTSRGALNDHLVQDHGRETIADLLISAAHPDIDSQPEPCTKKGYPTEADALHALLDTWRHASRSPRRKERRAYLCSRCGKWHLTSMPKGTDHDPDQ
jgi:hypothetical protein